MTATAVHTTTTKTPKHQSVAVVATKFTPSPWRNTVASVVAACEQSCKRLGVDQIDLYQLHMPDIVQPLRMFYPPGRRKDYSAFSKDELYWQGLAECYHLGLVKNVGVCNYGPTLLRACHAALAQRQVPLASNQIAYSLIGRGNGAQETVDACHELGVTVLGYFPFCMGLLTDKYSVPAAAATAGDMMQLQPHQQVGDEDTTKTTRKLPLLAETAGSLLSQRKKKTWLETRDLNRYAHGGAAGSTVVPAGGVEPLMRVMRAVALQRGKTVAQVALNYCICKGVIPIPGANTNRQVVDNIGAMGWRLSDEQVQLLETTADALGFEFEGAGFKRTSEKFVGYGVEKWRLD
jgi:pyridoxine 4-dehydrogenase